MLNSDFLTPFGHPLYLMAKPAGARCNLHCKYCYYISKRSFSCDEMDDSLLEEFIRQYLEAQTTKEVLFTWHGGEPLLRNRSFYEKALQLQQKYACGRHIDNCLQTNGTLLTDDWCRFFKENHFLLGISIDGPQSMHDYYRQRWHDVMRGISLLNRHEVMWNAMATVNRITSISPIVFYRFFRNLGCKYLQFTPVVERTGWTSGVVTPWSVEPDQWGDFLCQVFDEWVPNDVGDVFVQLFDATLANWLGVEPSLCSMATLCGQVGVIEANGDVYSCDHFVFPEYCLGNIRQHTITELMYGERQRHFGLQKRDALSSKCRRCPWLFACHGECPRNRFLPDNENYLCAGYLRFFEHVAPTMDKLASEYHRLSL